MCVRACVPELTIGLFGRILSYLIHRAQVEIFYDLHIVISLFMWFVSVTVIFLEL